MRRLAAVLVLTYAAVSIPSWLTSFFDAGASLVVLAYDLLVGALGMYAALYACLLAFGERPLGIRLVWRRTMRSWLPCVMSYFLVMGLMAVAMFPIAILALTVLAVADVPRETFSRTAVVGVMVASALVLARTAFVPLLVLGRGLGARDAVRASWRLSRGRTAEALAWLCLPLGRFLVVAFVIPLFVSSAFIQRLIELGTLPFLALTCLALARIFAGLAPVSPAERPHPSPPPRQ